MGFKICMGCGKKFDEKSRHHNAIYCSDSCRRNFRKITEQNKEKPKKKTPNKDIIDIAVEARKAGMTYGEYVAKHHL